MRAAFVGAVESSAAALSALCRLGSAPDVVVTLPPEKAVRHSDFARVDLVAETFDVPCALTPFVKVSGIVEMLRELRPEIIWVLGWSEILPAEVLNLASVGAIGSHPSLLPRMRGRAVIPWTILLGQKVTGTSLFWLDEGLDSGDLLQQMEFDVSADDDARSLYDKHVTNLCKMLEVVVPRLGRGVYDRTPQASEDASYCGRRTDRDGLIDWRRDASEVARLVRASSAPYPGAHTTAGREVLRVWRARSVANKSFYGVPGQVQDLADGCALVTCRDHSLLEIAEVQAPSADRVPAAEFLKRHQYLGA